MSKQYRVILADPPWSFRRNERRGAAEKHYPTMKTAEIKALPIRELAEPDSVLLLWATWANLPDALEVMGAWGFSYVTGLPWVKIIGAPQMDLRGQVQVRISYGVGFWVRGVTEPLLIGRRGNAKAPKGANFAGLLSPNYRHSRKPESVYHYAEALPGPYLELFARQARESWDSWGNEAEAPDWLDERLREAWKAKPERETETAEEQGAAGEPLPVLPEEVAEGDWRRSLTQGDSRLHLFRGGLSLCREVKEEKTLSPLPGLQGLGVSSLNICGECRRRYGIELQGEWT